MEVCNMHFVARCHVLEDIMMPGWYRVMDVILG